MAKLKLVIPSLSGFKGAAPQLPAGAKLVNVETGEDVPGVANITLQIPQGGTMRCTAEINLSAIEITEPIIAFVDVHANQQAEPGNGEAIGAKIETAEAAGLGYDLPPLKEAPK